MGRPRKIQINEEISEMGAMKQIQRVISKTNRTDANAGYFNVADVDTYVSGFLADGWKLHTVFYLGENPEGYIVWYVLVKE